MCGFDVYTLKRAWSDENAPTRRLDEMRTMDAPRPLERATEPNGKGLARIYRAGLFARAKRRSPYPFVLRLRIIHPRVRGGLPDIRENRTSEREAQARRRGENREAKISSHFSHTTLLKIGGWVRGNIFSGGQFGIARDAGYLRGVTPIEGGGVAKFFWLGGFRL